MFWLGKQKDWIVPREISPALLGFLISPHLFLSLTSPCLWLRLSAIAAHPANISQIHTGKGSEKGGRGRNACRRQRKGRGGRGGVFWDKSKCYDAAQRKRRCLNEIFSPLVTDILRLFSTLKLEKQCGLVQLNGNWKRWTCFDTYLTPPIRMLPRLLLTLMSESRGSLSCRC